MKVYVVNYALVDNFEAELDDPTLGEYGLDGMATPQFAAILTDVDALPRVMSQCVEEFQDLRDYISDEETGAEPDPQWKLRERKADELFWHWDLILPDSDTPVATLVVQEVEL